jgi:hypothetical protein
MNTTQRKDGSEHAEIFPIEVFFFSSFQKSLDQTIGDVLSCIHTGLNILNHTAIYFKEAIVKPTPTRSHLSWNPLKRFDEINGIRPRTFEGVRNVSRFIKETFIPVRSMNSMASSRAFLIRGDCVESVRMPKDMMSILLRDN